MNSDNLISLPTPETTESFSDALSDLIRRGARQIIAQAVEAELQEFLEQYQDRRDEQGRQVVVRNGYLPERTITTGVGEVAIQVPKVRDRSGSGVKFNSMLLPPYLKRASSVEELLPYTRFDYISYCTPEGVAQIRAALETIGITRTLLIRSSWSGGLHLYLPFAELVNTFNLAVALKECLRAQGFRLQAGQLEIFPNAKAYGVQTFIEYMGHRLPLQPGSGSCLLDDALNPIGSSLARFFWLWDGAAGHQDMEALRHGMKIGRDNHRKRPKRRSHPVDSWRQDLDLEITEGWTAYGQTNHLLKTIACYGRVFEGLQGQSLIDYTLRIALRCPGYEQYCRHQHETERKVTAWARAVEGYYWPLGSPPTRDTRHPQNNLVPFNQRQSEAAQHRIRTAYAELEQAGELPEQITARAKAIAQAAKVSQQTLYKHLSLWHPQHQKSVIAPTASLLAPKEANFEALPKTPEPREIKELHSLEEYMKGKALGAGGVGSDKKSGVAEHRYEGMK